MRGKSINTFARTLSILMEPYFSFSKKIESVRKYKYGIILYIKGDEFL